MLVLSRRENEFIEFPSLGITVSLLRINGKCVRIGVEAPREIPVLRGELVTAADRDALLGQGEKAFAHVIREGLSNAARILNTILGKIESCDWIDSERCVLRLFHQLKDLDEQAKTLLGDAAIDFKPRAKRALIVDDSENETKLLASFLRLKHFQVATASDGADALERLKEIIPDAIVLDMSMPKFDGRWTVDQIRSTPRYDGVQIIAVSGNHPNEHGVEIGPNGVDSWLRKPISPDELTQLIEGAMTSTN